jgi:tetratricopeptide (TPR) repeat protein
MRNLLVILLALAAAAPSHAASFDARLRDAYDLAGQGGFDEAVAALEELKVDYPEQPSIDYVMGSVRYRKGEGLAQAGDVEAAQAEFEAANKTFTGLSQHIDERLAIDASFGRANVLAQQAKMLAGPETFKEGVQALRMAEQAYVELLKRAPSHAGARQNLDHVRYILKQLLQNKPEEEKNEQEDQEQPPPPKGKVFSLFRGATTQVPDASAVVDGDTVRLQRQGGGS